MKYPSTWTTVYPAAGGQSSDHVYKVGSFIKLKDQAGMPIELNLKSKPVEQSSTSSGGDAKRAVDGSTNTKYNANSCTHTASDKNAWWRVDLQADVAVKTVTVYNRGDCCGGRLNGFEVKVGDEADMKSIKNARCGGKNRSEELV